MKCLKYPNAELQFSQSADAFLEVMGTRLFGEQATNAIDFREVVRGERRIERVRAGLNGRVTRGIVFNCDLNFNHNLVHFMRRGATIYGKIPQGFEFFPTTARQE